MHDWESLSHVRWDCKYHIVFIPKYRKKVMYGNQITVRVRNTVEQGGIWRPVHLNVRDRAE